MKLGFVSAILAGWDFYEMIDEASNLGYECVEVACWPRGEKERRYAGVSHIDTESLSPAKARELLDYCEMKHVQISSLAYYPNTMDPDIAKREGIIRHLKSVITASEMLNVKMVTTFIGRDQQKSIESNLALFQEVWPPLVEFAVAHGTKVAIENCPMLFGPDQWPGGQNLFTSPALWKKMFEIIDSPYFGINYDPSHFVWQQMDYLKPVWGFKDKIFHVHLKDIKILQDKLDEFGILAYPLDYMQPKIPGLGDVRWDRFISALTDIGYEGPACVEVEDRSFESGRQRMLDSLRLSKNYLRQFVI